MSARWIFALLIAAHAGCLEDDQVTDAGTTSDGGVSLPDAAPSFLDGAFVIWADAAEPPDARVVPGDASVSSVCELSVRPAVLDFGSAEVGRRSRLPLELVMRQAAAQGVVPPQLRWSQR